MAHRPKFHEVHQTSFVDNLADALSPDPVKNSRSGTTEADLITQAAANRLARNRPGVRRVLFGHGPSVDRLAQAVFDALDSDERD